MSKTILSTVICQANARSRFSATLTRDDTLLNATQNLEILKRNYDAIYTIGLNKTFA